MRTTLTIDSDVLYAAKEIAKAKNCTAGTVISDFFRRGLTAANPAVVANEQDRALAELGIQRFGASDALVTNEYVDRIREDLGI